MARKTVHGASRPALLIGASVAALVALVSGAAHATHNPSGDVVVTYNGDLAPMVTASGLISLPTNPNGYDWYRIEVTSGTLISATATRTSGDLLPNLFLYQGVVNDGQTVAAFPGPLRGTTENSNQAAVTFNFTPTFTGLATLGVSTWLGQTGNYNLVGTGFRSPSPQQAVIPEPGTLALAGTTVLPLVGAMVRKRRSLRA
jgi:hypothetical protein